MLQLRRFLENLMGVEPVAAGEDTQWHIRWNLGWPDWFVLLFAIFAVAWVVGIYLREGSVASRMFKLALASIRLVLIAMIVMMLAGVELAIDRTGLPYLALLVDDSESMQIRDRLAGDSPAANPSSRLTRVADWIAGNEEAFGELTARHKLQVYAQSRTPRLLGTFIDAAQVGAMIEQVRALEPIGTESRLGANVRIVLNLLRGTPPSAIVVLTDGVTTHGETLPQAAVYAARKGIPIYTVGVGDPETRRDLDLHDLLVDDVVFVDDIVSFEATLTGRGLEGIEATVALRQKGMPDPLDQKTYKVGKDGQPAKVRLAHRPTVPGSMTFSLDVPQAEREIQTDNNRIERTIQVVKEKIRVLYVESYPRYEFRYLKNLLERERTMELSVLLLDADPEFVQQDRVAIGFFPTSTQDLFAYDVLILGDVPATVFSQAQLHDMREFVKTKGGGLVVIAGRDFSPQAYRDTPLADLMPIEIAAATGAEWPSVEGFRPRLTVEGRASPIFRFAADERENEEIWNNLPPLIGYLVVPKAKPAAHVLAEHPSGSDGRPTPLIATQFFGAGRTYFQAFDCAWRWRFRSEDLHYARYWIQTIRFLARAKLLGKSRAIELLVDRRVYLRNEPVHLRVRFLDESLAPKGLESVTVGLERDGAANQSLELKRLAGHAGTFETVLGQTVEGRYRARLTDPVLLGNVPLVDFQVVPPPGELDRVQMNATELRETAEVSGGQYLALSDADRLFGLLPAGVPVALHTDPPFPLWRTWPVLAGFVVLLVAEWVLRKRKAML